MSIAARSICSRQIFAVSLFIAGRLPVRLPSFARWSATGSPWLDDVAVAVRAHGQQNKRTRTHVNLIFSCIS
jgi:hypothetical protein